MDLYFLPQPSRPATSPPSRPTPFSQQEEDTSTPARYSLSIIPPPRKRIHRIKPIDPAASGLWTVPEEVHEGWSSYDQEQFEEIDLEERTTAWQTRAAQSSFFEDDNDDEEDFEGVEGEEESGGTTQEVDNNELSSLDISRPKTYLDDMLSTLFTEAGFSDTSTKPPSTLLDGFNFILPTSPPPPLPSSPPPHSRHPFATSSPLVNPPPRNLLPSTSSILPPSLFHPPPHPLFPQHPPRRTGLLPPPLPTPLLAHLQHPGGINRTTKLCELLPRHRGIYSPRGTSTKTNRRVFARTRRRPRPNDPPPPPSTSPPLGSPTLRHHPVHPLVPNIPPPHLPPPNLTLSPPNPLPPPTEDPPSIGLPPSLPTHPPTSSPSGQHLLLPPPLLDLPQSGPAQVQDRPRRAGAARVRGAAAVGSRCPKEARCRGCSWISGGRTSGGLCEGESWVVGFVFASFLLAARVLLLLRFVSFPLAAFVPVPFLLRFYDSPSSRSILPSILTTDAFMTDLRLLSLSSSLNEAKANRDRA